MILLKDNQLPAMTNPGDIAKVCQDLLKADDKIDQDKERMYVFHLNVRNKIKLVELVSLGTLDGSMIHPREIYTRAVGERTAHIIVAHNHPSGNLDPSEADIIVTRRLVEAGKIIGIKLVDHILFTDKGFTSFKEKD